MATGTDAGVAIAVDGGTVNAGGASTGGWRPVDAGEGRGDGDGCDDLAGGTDPVVSTLLGRGRVTGGAGAVGDDCGGAVTERGLGGVQSRGVSSLKRSHQARADWESSRSQSRRESRCSKAPGR